MVLSSDTGALAVWNLQSCKQRFCSAAFAGRAVSCLATSPAVDVLAVGFADGRIALHNIKFDKVW